MNCKHIQPGIFSILVFLLTATTGFADDEHDNAFRLNQSGNILPLETILQNLQQAYPGRILEVELESEHGRYLYEIELLDQHGRVIEFKVNAVNGEIIRGKGED
jgi:uncharacterized membrane protein YkoI